LRIVIVSDIHANYDALSSITEAYDELWVLGDLVNYGPEPARVIDYLRTRAAVIISGNHDAAVGFGQASRCSDRFRAMAEATQRFTESVLDPVHKQFLRSLPQQAERKCGGTHFYLCHAVPSDPLYAYCGAESSRWLAETEDLPADVLLTGHTHIPFRRSIGTRMVVNPGSVGQPKHGRDEACYAILEDGRMELKSVAYPIDAVVAKVQAFPIAQMLRDELCAVLRTGSVTPAP